MKKVLVLAAAIALFATPSFAAIQGTKHDLSSGGGFGNGVNNEICVYCHTPHGANTGVTLAPLWNRTVTNATGSIYQGLDMNAPGRDLTSVNATDAPLCLSCHSGTTLTQTLQNPPNSAGALNTQTLAAAAETQLDTDLSDDHPIGFNFEALNALDSEIRTLGAATGNGVEFFGTNDKWMWCSSCHDVHDNSAPPFLQTSNADSALCTACHIK